MLSSYSFKLVVLRDRLAVSRAKGEGRTLRPPGRPFKHGWYSEGEAVGLFELVEAYRAANLNPDATDDDMLHLRARLQRLMSLEPDLRALRQQLECTLLQLQAWAQPPLEVEATSSTVAHIAEGLGRLTELTQAVVGLQSAYDRFSSLDAAIEARHERLITLAKVRADTRVKNKAAEQLDVFVLMLERLMLVLKEGLAPEDFLALQRRLVRDLEQVPKRALEPNAVYR